MKLDIEILTGKRKGTRLILEEGRGAAEALPYLLETEAVSISLYVNEPWTKVNLLLENVTVELYSSGLCENGCYCYQARPSFRKDGGLEALFYNYFGVAIFYVLLEQLDKCETVEFGQIEILARKASVAQIEKMVDYILREGEDDLLRSLGATRRGVGHSEAGNTPQRLLEHLDVNLQLLENLAPNILYSPLSILTTQLEMVSVSENTEILDQGITWLLENLSVLELAPDIDSAVFEYDFTYYAAKEIQTSVQKEGTDIYENRVIHGYLEKMLEFTQEIIRGFSDSKIPISLNSHDGYVSFFATMQQWMRKEGAVHIQRICQLQERIRRMQASFECKVPVRALDYTLPRFTQRVKANRYYAILFRSIYQWYTCNSINWQGRQFLMAIRSIPKLFELYALMTIRHWCRRNGVEHREAEAALWNGYVGSQQISLYYEPIYWMEGHVQASGKVVNIENRKWQNAKSDFLGKKRTGSYQCRSPDIVLEVVGACGEVTLIIMDAKYTTAKDAFVRDLPACTLKYVHGLACRGSKHIVSAMIILYPDEVDSYMDYRVKPYDVFGENAQIPILGAQALCAGDRDEKNSIDKLMRRILEIV